VVGYLPGGGVDGLDCDSPLLVVCRVCDGRLVWACRAHRASRCVPCSERYRRLLVRIAQSRSASAHRGHGFFLTLTAPGEREHARWIPGRPGGGGPCACRVGDLAEWNAAAGQAWNRLRLGLSRLCPFEYFRVVEVQKRGALHLHILVWSAEPLRRDHVQELAVAAGFGCQVDLSPLSPQKHANYAAKYATKATDQRGAVPWAVDVVNTRTGELTRGSAPARYRTWSSSRQWGLTVREVRAANRAAMENSRLARSAGVASADQPTPSSVAQGPTAAGGEPRRAGPSTAAELVWA
jgi:hypothetical protein